MEISVRRCLGITPWNNNDLGVASETAKIRIGITSSILAQMGTSGESIGIYGKSRC